MKITPGHTNAILAFGCLSFVILVGGSINAILTYSTQGIIPPITEGTIWLGLIGLFSAIAASIEICSNIEVPIKEDKPIRAHNTSQKPSAFFVQETIGPLQSQTTEPLSHPPIPTLADTKKSLVIK